VTDTVLAFIVPDLGEGGKLMNDGDPNTLYTCFNGLGLDMTKVGRPLPEKKNIVLKCKSAAPAVQEADRPGICLGPFRPAKSGTLLFFNRLA